MNTRYNVANFNICLLSNAKLPFSFPPPPSTSLMRTLSYYQLSEPTQHTLGQVLIHSKFVKGLKINYKTVLLTPYSWNFHSTPVRSTSDKIHTGQVQCPDQSDQYTEQYNTSTCSCFKPYLTNIQDSTTQVLVHVLSLIWPIWQTKFIVKQYCLLIIHMNMHCLLIIHMNMLLIEWKFLFN